MCECSVVIPLYREAKRIPVTLPKLATMLERLPFSTEVILVSEPGDDNTAEVGLDLAETYGWRFIETPVHLGKGAAVRSGVMESRGSFVCYMDADLSTDPEALGRAIAIFEQTPSISVVVGDRCHTQSEMIAKQGGLRIILGRVFNYCVRLLFPSIRLKDTQCGFKVFRRNAVDNIFPYQKLNGFAFDVELILRANYLGEKICTLPVRWTDASHSKVRITRDSIKMMKDLIRLRFSSRALKQDM